MLSMQKSAFLIRMKNHRNLLLKKIRFKIPKTFAKIPPPLYPAYSG